MALTILSHAYVLIALVFLALTFFEGWKRRSGWGAYRVFGLLLCTVWPLLVIHVLMSETAAAQSKSRA